VRSILRVTATFLLCALLIEVAYRALSGAPVFTLISWRDQRFAETDLQSVTRYDPLLGWVTASGVRSNWFNTVQHGIRINAGLRHGGHLLRLESSPHAEIRKVGNRDEDPAFRLTAAGNDGEHFIGVGGISVEPGVYEVTIFAKSAGGDKLRVQVFDETAPGVIVDFDVAHDRHKVIRLGSSGSADVTTQLMNDGWSKLSVKTALQGKLASVLLQILNEAGSTSFQPTNSGGVLLSHAVLAKEGAAITMDVPGAVLVVGNSFAAGAQTNDDETWPAHLEGLLKRPVYNAGVGSYGVDQMVLHAQKLVPLVQPNVVIAAIQFDMVLVNEYRTYNAPKPYFMVENGILVRRNDPVPRREEAPDIKARIMAAGKQALGFSYVIDRVAMKAAPKWWTTDETKGQFIKVNNDGIDISCRLLGELKAELDARGIRLLVMLQENGQITVIHEKPPPQTAEVLKCAREQGIQAVNTWDRLKPIARGSREEFEKLFVMGEGKDAFGHMSSAGNRLVAEMIAEALSAPGSHVGSPQ
jgi:hypothetical protein